MQCPATRPAPLLMGAQDLSRVNSRWLPSKHPGSQPQGAGQDGRHIHVAPAARDRPNPYVRGKSSLRPINAQITANIECTTDVDRSSADDYCPVTGQSVLFNMALDPNKTGSPLGKLNSRPPSKQLPNVPLNSLNSTTMEVTDLATE